MADGPLTDMGGGRSRISHLSHEEVDIRPSLLDTTMLGLFASPRHSLSDERSHLRREAHSRGVIGKGVGADGRKVAFAAEAEVCDYGGQYYDDRYRVSLAAPLTKNAYV